MYRLRTTALQLFLPSLLLTCLSGCVEVVDDDDGSGDSVADTADSDSGSGSDSGDDSDESSQGRSVYACEARVVCQDGGVTEAGQPLCLTAQEASEEIALIGEACTENMPIVCEGIGDGSSVECGGECTNLDEACECEDPARGCEV